MCYLIVLIIMIVVIQFLLLDWWKGHGPIHDLKDDLLRRAFSSHQPIMSSRTQSVLEKDGLIPAILFFVFGVARWFMPTFLLIRPMAKWLFNETLWNRAKNKSYPWWHDFSYIISILILGVFPWIFCKHHFNKGQIIFCWWLLLDIFIYHVNMFWFDDLRPWNNAEQSDRPAPVWSLRRVSLQAIISYIVSTFIFARFYYINAIIHGENKDPIEYLIKSISIATMNIPLDRKGSEGYKLVGDVGFDLGMGLQIFFYLILLVIIISSTASAMFRRDEFRG